MPEVQPVQEGSRWRYAKPSSEEVGAWFGTVPIDEGLDHKEFVSGVVVIPAAEKVKTPKADGRGTEEKSEATFTPYMRVDTRVAYFHKLAAARDLIAVIEPVEVPRIQSGDLMNVHMPPGYWWHIVMGESRPLKYLCCTMRVALYREADYFDDLVVERASGLKSHRELKPVRFGVSTKQVHGGADLNGLAKAETGAIGRALGVAGILVVGTGIATAEDMAELGDRTQAAAELPASVEPETSEALNERLIGLQSTLRPYAEQWSAFSAWWQERAREAGWRNLSDAPLEVRRGMVTRMQEAIAEGEAAAPAETSPAPQDSSRAVDAAPTEAPAA